MRITCIVAVLSFVTFYQPAKASSFFQVEKFNCFQGVEDHDDDSKFSILFGGFLDGSESFVFGTCRRLEDCHPWTVLNTSFSEQIFVLTAQYESLHLSLEIQKVKDMGEFHPGSYRIGEREYQVQCEAKYTHSVDVTQLIEELRSNDLGIRLQALAALESLGPQAVEAVRPLINALQNDPEAQVRSNAANALGAIGKLAYEAIIPVIFALDDSEFSVHISAGLALIGIVQNGKFSRKLMEEVRDLLYHPRPKIREGAAETLGHIGSAAVFALPDLLQCSNDTDKSVQRSCIHAIGEIGPGAVEAMMPLLEIVKNGQGHRLSGVASGALSKIGPVKVEYLDDLIAYLQYDEYSVSKVVMSLLGEMGKNAIRAIPAITQAMKNHALLNDGEHALKKIDLELAVPFLIKLIEDTKVYSLIRADLIFLLGEMQMKANLATTAIIQSTRDQDDYVRQRAVQALGKIGPVEVVLDALITAFSDSNPIVREYTATAVGDLGPKAARAISFLVQLLQDTSEFTVYYSIVSLGKMGHEASSVVPTLRQIANDVSRKDFLREAALEAIEIILND